MPLQFLHSFRSLFGGLIRWPSFQSSCNLLVSQIFPNTSCSILVELSKSALMSSGWLTLGQAALPFFQMSDGSLDLCFTWPVLIDMQWRVISLPTLFAVCLGVINLVIVMFLGQFCPRGKVQ